MSDAIVTEAIIRQLTLILDGADEHLLTQIRVAALGAYERSGADRRAVGAAVGECIADMVDESSEGTAHMILTDVLNLTSSMTQDLLGAHYMPSDS